MSGQARKELSRYTSATELYNLEFDQRRALAEAIRATLLEPPFRLRGPQVALLGAGGFGFVWMVAHLARLVFPH